jgi:hypothetical protein
MACTIHISSILGTPSGASTQIAIDGSATDCTNLIVKITCGQFTVNIPVTVNPNGTWSLTTLTDCVCAGNVNIDVVCVGSGCSDSFNGPLPCVGPCCPRLIPTITVGDCDAQGNRPVTISTQVGINAGQPSCIPVSIQWNFGDGTLGPVQTYPTAGNYTYNVTHSYNPSNSPYSAVLNVLAPTGCPGTPVTVTVAPCSQPCCPELTTEVKIGDCENNGNKTVTFNNTINVQSGAGCLPVTVQRDFGDGTSGSPHTYNVAGSYTYSETHSYPANNGTFTSTLNIISPTHCIGTADTFNIGCCYAGWLRWFCPLLKGLFYFSFGLGALLLALYFSCAANPYVLISALASIVVAFIWALLYWILCPKCAECGWILLWMAQILFYLGLALMFMDACCNGLFTNGIIMVGVALLFYLLWAIICNRSFCDVLENLVYIPMFSFLSDLFAWPFVSSIFSCTSFAFLYLLLVILLVLILLWIFCPEARMVSRIKKLLKN